MVKKYVSKPKREKAYEILKPTLEDFGDVEIDDLHYNLRTTFDVKKKKWKSHENIVDVSYTRYLGREGSDHKIRSTRIYTVDLETEEIIRELHTK